MSPRQGEFQRFTERETAQTIPQRFSQQVAHYPESAAVETPTRSVTYAELDRLSNQVANAILDRSPGNSNTIAMLLEQGIESVITILGVLKAGKSMSPSIRAQTKRSFIDLSRTATRSCSLPHRSIDISEKNCSRIRPDCFAWKRPLTIRSRRIRR
jgi:acyl-CoA synthetase (AMP-forming)/AMP-acid ligase II